MAAESKTDFRLLADTLAELLRDKIQAGPDVIEYIDSTYGNPDAEEIKALIDEHGSSERETLVELLFFPDESIQVQLEAVLQEHACAAEDVAAIADELANRNITAAVSLGDSGRTLAIRVDRTVIDPFLTRLNIAYAPDTGLSRTIAEVLPSNQRIAVGVRFRNAGTRPDGQVRDLLDRYIRAMHADGFFFEDLDFLLEFVQEIDGDTDIYEAMMKKKRRSWRQLNKVEGVEKRLRKSNVETLLLQGERVPYIDRHRTLKTIAAIDRICLAVFGRTDSIEALDRSDAGWDICGAQDAAAMIRRMSS
ncbi:MAG: hypothetical protein AMJ54_12790 [Deltaproteobacteria bacterium SG8_13]|nr:MAG: hypothetical protein AMJ54_12790 [Deltaproteobacteria bacterium SG8_13]